MMWLAVVFMALGSTVIVVALITIMNTVRELLFGWLDGRQAQRQRDLRLLQAHEEPPEDWDGSSPLQ